MLPVDASLSMDDPIAPDPRPEPAPLETRLPTELPHLRAFLRKRLGGAPGDVDDLLQEVVARAWRYRASYDEGRPLGPWLRRMALRVVLDHHEHGARRVVTTTEGLDEASDNTAERGLVQLEQREEVARLLEHLTDVERLAVVGFHRDGRSIRELSHELRMPEGTVKSHLHRARRRLRSVPALAPSLITLGVCLLAVLAAVSLRATRDESGADVAAATSGALPGVAPDVVPDVVPGVVPGAAAGSRVLSYELTVELRGPDSRVRTLRAHDRVELEREHLIETLPQTGSRHAALLGPTRILTRMETRNLP